MTMSEVSLTTVDTNVIVRHLLDDHEDHSPRASALFLRVRQGEEAVFCPDTVIFEAVYILHGLAGAPRSETANSLLLLIELPLFHMAHKSAIKAGLGFWTTQRALDFADCYHFALTEAMGMTRIYTFGKKMDRYPGVERVEP